MLQRALGLVVEVLLRKRLGQNPDEAVARRVRDRVVASLELDGARDGLGAGDRLQVLVTQGSIAVHGQRTRRAALPGVSAAMRSAAPMPAVSHDSSSSSGRPRPSSRARLKAWRSASGWPSSSGRDRLRRAALVGVEPAPELLLGDRGGMLGRQAAQADRRRVEQHARARGDEQAAVRGAEHEPLRGVGCQLDILEREDRATAAQEPLDAQVAALDAALVELVEDGVQQVVGALAATVEIDDPVAHLAHVVVERLHEHVRLADAGSSEDVDDPWRAADPEQRSDLLITVDVVLEACRARVGAVTALAGTRPVPAEGEGQHRTDAG